MKPHDSTTSSPVPDEPLLSEFFDESSELWLEELREAQTGTPLGQMGRYELLREISRGGQGIVYLARCAGRTDPVVLKRLIGGPFAGPAMQRRLEREIDALRNLSHPNIVRVLGVEVLAGAPVIVMEHIDAVPLDRWASGDGVRPRLDEKLEVFCKVCRAVQYAHQSGVLHRDLKPSNILVDARNEPQVVDFGLAKPLHAPASATTQFVGTVEYAAPEQLSGPTSSGDVRSDTYSLGVILYELITGRPPYKSGTGLAETIRAITESPVPHLAGLPIRRPRDLNAVIQKALAKSPGSRYQSAASLEADVAAWLGGAPVLARLPGGLTQLATSLRRHRQTLAVSAPLAVVCVVAAIVSTVMAVRYERQRDVALAAREAQMLARTRADRETESAQAVAAFLQQTLTNSEVRREPTVTLRAVIDGAADQLARGTLTSIEARARLRMVIGSAYENLGLFGEAANQYQEAVAESKRLNDRQAVARSLALLAAALHQSGDMQRQRRTVKELIPLYRALVATGEVPPYFDASGVIGYLARIGDLDAAEAFYQDVLSHARASADSDPRPLAFELFSLADFLLVMRQPARAEPYIREALGIREALVRRKPDGVGEDVRPLQAAATLPADRDLVALVDSKAQLARFLLATGDVEQARTLALEVLDLRHSESAAPARGLAEAHDALARVHARTASHEEAAEQFAAALEIRLRLEGRHGPTVADARLELARSLILAGMPQSAEPHLRDALETRRASLGAFHWRTAVAEAQLGRCMQLMGIAPADARDLLLNSCDCLLRTRGAGHAKTRECLEWLENAMPGGPAELPECLHAGSVVSAAGNG